MKNDGKGYEALTEEVFRRLLAQQALCADVVRDSKVEGRGATHQIDVLFRFRAAGMDYLTIVQCKDWGSAVKQEQVFAFHTVLQDIPGQPRGVMVARSGFQEGARDYARHHGIQLYELRAPKDEDWEGLIREIRLDLRFLIPSFRNVAIKFDDAWIEAELRRRGVIRTGQKHIVSVMPGSFRNAAGERVDFRRLLAPLAPEALCDWQPVEHLFTEPLEVDVEGLPILTLRALGFSAEVRVEEDRRQVAIRTDHLIAYCFRDVLSGTIEFLDQDGAQLGEDEET
jgi:hypothetical protein